MSSSEVAAIFCIGHKGDILLMTVCPLMMTHEQGVHTARKVSKALVSIHSVGPDGKVSTYQGVHGSLGASAAGGDAETDELASMESTMVLTSPSSPQLATASAFEGSARSSKAMMYRSFFVPHGGYRATYASIGNYFLVVISNAVLVPAQCEVILEGLMTSIQLLRLFDASFVHRSVEFNLLCEEVIHQAGAIDAAEIAALCAILIERPMLEPTGDPALSTCEFAGVAGRKGASSAPAHAPLMGTRQLRQDLVLQECTFSYADDGIRDDQPEVVPIDEVLLDDGLGGDDGEQDPRMAELDEMEAAAEEEARQMQEEADRLAAGVGAFPPELPTAVTPASLLKKAEELQKKSSEDPLAFFGGAAAAAPPASTAEPTPVVAAEKPKPKPAGDFLDDLFGGGGGGGDAASTALPTANPVVAPPAQAVKVDDWFATPAPVVPVVSASAPSHHVDPLVHTTSSSVTASAAASTPSDCPPMECIVEETFDLRQDGSTPPDQVTITGTATMRVAPAGWVLTADPMSSASTKSYTFHVDLLATLADLQLNADLQTSNSEKDERGFRFDVTIGLAPVDHNPNDASSDSSSEDDCSIDLFQYTGQCHVDAAPIQVRCRWTHEALEDDEEEEGASDPEEMEHTLKTMWSILPAVTERFAFTSLQFSLRLPTAVVECQDPEPELMGAPPFTSQVTCQQLGQVQCSWGWAIASAVRRQLATPPSITLPSLLAARFVTSTSAAPTVAYHINTEFSAVSQKSSGSSETVRGFLGQLTVTRDPGSHGLPVPVSYALSSGEEFQCA